MGTGGLMVRVPFCHPASAAYGAGTLARWYRVPARTSTARRGEWRLAQRSMRVPNPSI